MKKVWHLANCKTCQRIIAELELEKHGFELQNIKEENIDAKTLDAIKEQEGSYEAIFSRRAMKYRSLGLNEKTLSESEYRKWILEEYTFLKRPVIQIGEAYFVGSTKAVIAKAKEKIG